MWLSIAWRGSRVKGLALWGWANLLFSAGGMVGSLRDGYPGWVAVDLGNALIIAATGLCWSAARRFGDRTPLAPHAFLGSLIWLLLRQVPGLMELVEIRIVIASVIAGFYIMATAWEFYRQRGGKTGLPRFWC
jgi:hypothetical protein